METLGASNNSRNSSKLLPDDPGRASILGSQIYELGGDTITIIDNIYNLTPDVYKALSSIGYGGETKKEETAILMMDKIIMDLNHTGIDDRTSGRKTFSAIALPNSVRVFQYKTFDEIIDKSDELEE